MLKKVIIGIVLNGAALYGVTYIVPGITYTGDWEFFVVGALVMGILNSIVKPILTLITLPIHILTLGLSLFFLNIAIFWIFKFVIDTIVIKGVTLQVADLRTYALAGLVFGVINWIEHMIIHNK